MKNSFKSNPKTSSKNPIKLIETEKIQKVLAAAGTGSRREIEAWIQEGRITVNNKLAKIGDRMTYNDKVCIDGREINLIKSKNQKTRVLLYHKPEGEMCTRHDPDRRPTIFDHLPLIRNGRWITIGRLDYNTSGLLLLTNNGNLANQLMHPSQEIEREYAVRIRGSLTEAMTKKLLKGVRLEDGIARFHAIEEAGSGQGTNHWYHVIVKEGRNRLVRRLFESQNLIVSRLMRIRFGPVVLTDGLRRAHYIELTDEEINELMKFSMGNS